MHKPLFAIFDRETKVFVRCGDIPMLFMDYLAAVETREHLGLELGRYEIQEVVVQKRFP